MAYFIAEALPVYFSKNSPAQTRQVCGGWGGGLGFAYEGGLVSSAGFQILVLQVLLLKSEEDSLWQPIHWSPWSPWRPLLRPLLPSMGTPWPREGRKLAQSHTAESGSPGVSLYLPEDGNTHTHSHTHTHTHTHTHGGTTLHAPCLLNKTTLISGFQPLLWQGGARKRSSFFKKDKASFFLC